MKDFRDKEIVVGDSVLVAHRKGSSVWLEQRLVVGMVTDLLGGTPGVPIIKNLVSGKTYTYRGMQCAIARL